MKGADFAQEVQLLYNESGQGHSKGFGVIKANPDKSKHLETATINIEHQWIDFVNLRKEEYTQNSRIPTMEFGTPLEDAMRRDLTINSLFYNINLSKVEDFTGRGLDDLKAGIIRTPLKAHQTFLDDPLRILRTFRFAARYGYIIDEEILQALTQHDVLQMLQNKVSKERIGLELEPALSHINCVNYLNMLYENHLLPVVFSISQKTTDPVSPDDIVATFNKNSRVWNSVLKVADAHTDLFLKANLESPGTLRLYLMLSSMLLGFQNKKYTSSYLFCEHFLKESLKLKNKISDDVKTILKGVTELQKFVDTIPATVDEWDIAEQLGMMIREYGVLYPFAFIIALAEEPKPERLQRLKHFIKIIKDKQIANFNEVKPLLNGNDIMKELKVTGKEIKPIADKALKWQIRNPAGTKEDLLKHLKV